MGLGWLGLGLGLGLLGLCKSVLTSKEVYICITYSRLGLTSWAVFLFCPIS